MKLLRILAQAGWLHYWDGLGVWMGVRFIERRDLVDVHRDAGRMPLVGMEIELSLSRSVEAIEDGRDWRLGWRLSRRIRSDAGEIAVRLAGGLE